MSKKDASLIKNTCKFYYTTDNIGSNDDPINALRKKKIPASEKQWKQYQKKSCSSFIIGRHRGIHCNMQICNKDARRYEASSNNADYANEKSGDVVCMDLGANSDCTTENLHEFAIIGNIMAKVSFNKKKPKVGILNIGTEEIKGTKLVQDAYKIIKKIKQ